MVRYDSVGKLRLFDFGVLDDLRFFDTVVGLPEVDVGRVVIHDLWTHTNSNGR
jgi:hypothetical protein